MRMKTGSSAAITTAMGQPFPEAARRLASRSSAPCRMKIAACSSITSARLARLTSMPISSRSTAAVESLSSHSPIGSVVRAARLRAKARVDCEQAGGVLLERLAMDGLDAGGKPAVRIGHGNADGLGAEIEPDQPAAFGPVGCSIDQGQDESGHGLAHITRRAAA